MSDLPSRRTKVFVSYSNRDDRWRDELEVYLDALSEDIEVWIDTAIDTGAPWLEEIETALNEARVAILLISPHFVASDFIQRVEVPHFLAASEKEGLAIVPVYVAPSEIPDELLEIQAVNRPEKTLLEMEDGERGRAWLKVLDAVKAALAKLVLVSVAGEDLDAAEEILAPLEQRGMGIDLQVWELADEKTTGMLGRRLKQRNSGLILVGRRGRGPWAQPELRSALAKEIGRDKRVVAAHLPGATAKDIAGLSTERTRIELAKPLGGRLTTDALWRLLTGDRWRRERRERREAPAAPPQPPGVEEKPFEAAIANLVPRLNQDHLTIFVGSGACLHDDAETHSWHGWRPGDSGLRQQLPEDDPDQEGQHRPYEVSRRLLEDIGLNHTEFLPPLDVVGTYYETQRDESRLESRFHELIGNKRAPISPCHRQIAALLKQLQESDTKRRLIGQSEDATRRRLIVTTNFDLLMERALLEAGVPFTRIVQHRSGSRIHINEYRDVEIDGRHAIIRTRKDQEARVALGDIEEMRNAISALGREEITHFSDAADSDSGSNSLYSLSLRLYRSPYLYKFHGSEDSSDSCAISLDQYFRFIGSVLQRKIVPAEVEAYLNEGQVLFIGYGLLDPDFRVIVHTLLDKRSGTEGKREWRYAVLLPPQDELFDDYRRAELRLWRKLKRRVRDMHGIKVVEGLGRKFLKELVDRL